MGENFSGKLDETITCKNGNFLKVVHCSTIFSTGVRGSFLKTDVKRRTELKLVEPSINPLTPKLDKTLVLLGKFDRYFKNRYPNSTLSLFM